MARSHHRKKHKEHLRQFKHQQDTLDPSSSKTKTTGIFTGIGAALGFAISYFAVQGSFIWTAVGILAGAILGYYVGRNIDNDKA